MRPVDGVYMGWWPGEGDGLKWIAHYGIPVWQRFFLQCHGLQRCEAEHPYSRIPPPAPLENKVYVALILSDGDNVQYMQHTMKVGWETRLAAAFRIGWTASPWRLDLDPAMLDYYWSTATRTTVLVSGPSGPVMRASTTGVRPMWRHLPGYPPRISNAAACAS